MNKTPSNHNEQINKVKEIVEQLNSSLLEFYELGKKDWSYKVILMSEQQMEDLKQKGYDSWYNSKENTLPVVHDNLRIGVTSLLYHRGFAPLGLESE